MEEENKVGYFDEMAQLDCGVKVRKHLHWNEINGLAQEIARAMLFADEESGTLVYTGDPSYSVEAVIFLRHCTDFDMSKFTYEETGDINIEALMDWAMENGILEGHYSLCESWRYAYNMAYHMADIINEEHKQKMDFGHRLTMAFGDILDGSTKEVIENATGLGETLIDLIGKSKEAAKPQGGIVNFAKKK